MLKQLSSHLYSVRDLFSPEIQRRGFNRGFNGFRHTLDLLQPFWTEGAKVKVLDVGAGAGVVSLALSVAGAECHVMDTWYEYSDDRDNQMGSVDDILSRFQSRGMTINHHNILNVPWNYPDASFDVVLFLAVIEHLPESPDRVLREIRRVLKPNGHLVLTTPNVCCLANRLKMLGGQTIHFPLRMWYGVHPFTGHYREYTIAEVKEMLRLSGFKLLKLDVSDSDRFNTLRPDGTWDFRYRLNSTRQLLKTIYLGVVQLRSSLRYAITTIARKEH
jgi:2-polyprenyl-3-methyl-5-hydroxy-6-metoxy-1,4-benzoquinol methylase